MVRAFIRVTPIAPPIIPPIACNPAHPATPPQLVRAWGGMKNNPIIEPATAAENTEITNRVVEPASRFSNIRLYPLKKVRRSNMTDAAKKPKK